MTTYDTPALIVASETTPNTLPDPVSVVGRTHTLVNTGAVSAVWTSTGALPYQLDGVGLATLTAPRGSVTQVQSNGARWVVIRSTGARPAFAGTAVTDASGNAVFSFPAGTFPVAPTVTSAVQFPASQNPLDWRVTALTATSCTVNVKQSPTLVVLSLSVLGVAANISGVTVHLIATSSGVTP